MARAVGRRPERGDVRGPLDVGHTTSFVPFRLERRITCDVTQIRLLVELVRAGIGVAIVPRRIGEDAGLPCVGIRQPEPGRTVVLAGRAPRPRNPAAEALLARLTTGRAPGTGDASPA